MTNENLTVGVKRMVSGAKLPNRAYPQDSGADLFYCSPKGEGYCITIQPFTSQVLETALKFKIPESQYTQLFDVFNVKKSVLVTWEIQLRSKSGMSAKHNLFVLNSPGTVDSNYVGEIKVILYNASDKPQIIQHGDKIAQAVLCPVVCCDYEETDDLDNSDRGENGFGHTGK